PRLVAAGKDDRDPQRAEPAGRLQADPLVRPGDERDLVHGLPPLLAPRTQARSRAGGYPAHSRHRASHRRDATTADALVAPIDVRTDKTGRLRMDSGVVCPCGPSRP